ncbi:hypothetical protein V2J09_012508 [Rumex salicifolius]
MEYFWRLFVVALFPVMKVLLVTLVGLFLALDRINVLGSTARTILNHVVYASKHTADLYIRICTWMDIVEDH